MKIKSKHFSQSKKAKLAYLLEVPEKYVHKVKFTSSNGKGFQVLYYVEDEGFYFIWGFWQRFKVAKTNLFKNKKIYQIGENYFTKAPNNPKKILELAKKLVEDKDLYHRTKLAKRWGKNLYLPIDEWTID